MSNTTLDWALWLAERGFLIAPLPTGSKSPTLKWKDVHTTSPDRIKSWFDCAPDMNYLVCPGVSYAIVDVDVKEHDGLAVFNGVQEENSPAPTFTVDTPSGGRHFYYKTDNPTGNGHSFPPGMGDLRGAGGYVVGPGSTFEGKVYTVADPQEPQRAPDWLQTMFKPLREKDTDVDTPLCEPDLPDAVQRAKEFILMREPAVTGKQGDEHTFVTFQLLKDIGLSKDRALNLLLEPGGWNERCDPPWDAGELSIKADNAYVYGKNRLGSKGGSIIDLYEPDDMVDVSDLLPTVEEDKDPFSQLRPFLLRGDGLWEADTYQRYIIPEWLPDKGYACVLARRGVGKTTVMLDMASCISMDMEWHGWPVLTGYHSIYFCGEHDTVALQLLRAWKDHNLGVDVASNNRFIFIRNAGDLLDNKRTEQWMQLLRQQIGPQGKAAVFLDTWQRATAGGSQNDDAEMQKATHNAEILAAYLGGPMVVAVHPPKSEGEIVMGSSIIENNSAAIMTLTNVTGGKKLEVTRMKGRGEGNTMELDFETIHFGENDEHGREITGQAVSRTGGTSPIPGQPDDNVPDSPTAETSEDKTERKRLALGKFCVLFTRYHRDIDPKASAKIKSGDVADQIMRLRGISSQHYTEIDLELREAGGDELFEGAAKKQKFTRMIRACFIATQSPVTVVVDKKEWDVKFTKYKTSELLEINEAFSA